MARGKYAARAANRLAEIDEGITAELRAKLAATVAELAGVRAEVEALRRARAAEAQQIGADLAAEQIRELTEQLTAERAARDADRQRYADEVFAVLRTTNAKLSYPGFEGVAAVFGQTHRIGQLISGGEGSRTTRRANGTHHRLVGELKRQGRV